MFFPAFVLSLRGDKTKNVYVMNYTIHVRVCSLLTTDIIGVDVLDRSSADVCGLSSQGDSPQLIHTTQLQRERESQREHIETNQRDFEMPLRTSQLELLS